MAASLPLAVSSLVRRSLKSECGLSVSVAKAAGSSAFGVSSGIGSSPTASASSAKLLRVMVWDIAYLLNWTGQRVIVLSGAVWVCVVAAGRERIGPERWRRPA